MREQAGDLEVTLARLARFGLLDAADVGRVRQLVLARRTFEAVPFLLQLDDEEVARYAVHRHELPGVLLETRMARHYPHGTIGAHALGYVGTISEDDMKRVDRERYFGTGVIGKTGVERAYEDELLGAGGYREVLVNAEGRPSKLPRAQISQLDKREPLAGKRSAADDRHRAAARRRGGLGRPARRGGRDRPRRTATCSCSRACPPSTRTASRAASRAATTSRSPRIPTSRSSTACCAAPTRRARPSSR